MRWAHCSQCNDYSSFGLCKAGNSVADHDGFDNPFCAMQVGEWQTALKLLPYPCGVPRLSTMTKARLIKAACEKLLLEY